MKNKWIIKLIVVALLIASSGCGAYLHQPLQTSSARIGEETLLNPVLRQLPPPQEKIVTAVYKFRDQTGQYKPSELASSWSTAVTQGATNILIKALDESGWFIPIERENLNNLLNERKIIRSSRSQYAKENEAEQTMLPPLLFAGVIVEGGIVSYDSNILTGGLGVRYFGTGGSGQYRQDRVTVYLRVVSTSTGKILKTVYASKMILSQAVDVGVFRFVKFKRLLEAETGFTYNEPTELAVTEAIEKAVQSLVLEGIIDGLWGVAPEKIIEGDEAISEYLQEKAEMQQIDLFGRKYRDYNHQVGFQMSASALMYQGDYPEPEIHPGPDIGLDLFITPRYAVELNWGMSKLSTERIFEEKIGYMDVGFNARILPHDRFTPFVYAGGGMVYTRKTDFDYYFKIHGGAGFDYHITKFLSANLALDYNYFLDDEVDQLKTGKYNDFFWKARLGVTFYLDD